MSSQSQNKTPLGKPLELTDEELELLAEITPEDVEAAKKAWRKHAPRKFKSLLDAEPIESEE